MVVARSMPEPFVLCARADGVMNGFYDVDEAIPRICAFEGVGADLLYVAMPVDVDGLRRVVASVRSPVNALAAWPFAVLLVADFAEIGVRRISVGSQIARVTHAAIRDLTTAMLDEGDFTGFAGAADGGEIDGLLARGGSG